MCCLLSCSIGQRHTIAFPTPGVTKTSSRHMCPCRQPHFWTTRVTTYFQLWLPESDNQTCTTPCAGSRSATVTGLPPAVCHMWKSPPSQRDDVNVVVQTESWEKTQVIWQNACNKCGKCWYLFPTVNWPIGHRKDNRPLTRPKCEVVLCCLEDVRKQLITLMDRCLANVRVVAMAGQLRCHRRRWRFAVIGTW